MKKKDEPSLRKINKQQDGTEVDEYEDQKFVDDIPLENLKIEAEQSARKYDKTHKKI